MDDRQRHRNATFTGAGLTVIALFVPILFPTMNPYIAWIGLISGVLLLFWGLWPVVAATWRPKFGRLVRTPLRDVYQAAWDSPKTFGNKGTSFIEFASALRQAASDGDLKFCGRSQRLQNENAIRREPLVQIPIGHWKDFELENDLLDYDNAGNVVGIQSDNFRASTKTPGRTRRPETFTDLHVDNKGARRWLKSQGL